MSGVADTVEEQLRDNCSWKNPRVAEIPSAAVVVAVDRKSNFAVFAADLCNHYYFDWQLDSEFGFVGIRNLAIGNTDVDWMLGKVVVMVVDNHRNKVVVAEEFEVAAVAGLAQQLRVIQQ